MFIFSNMFSKLPETWNRGRLLYGDYNFDIYFFKFPFHSSLYGTGVHYYQLITILKKKINIVFIAIFFTNLSLSIIFSKLTQIRSRSTLLHADSSIQNEGISTSPPRSDFGHQSIRIFCPPRVIFWP